MYFPEGFEHGYVYDYDGEDEDDPEDDYDEEDYYHHHGFDDLYDDVGEDYDYLWHWHIYDDQWTAVKDHEIFLFEYSPESKEEEEPRLVDVLMLAEMTIKLVDALKLRLSSEEMDRFVIVLVLGLVWELEIYAIHPTIIFLSGTGTWP